MGAANTNLTADANDRVRHVIEKVFSVENITQTLVPGQPMASYEYRLREFKGNATYPSNRTVVVQTECHTYVVRNQTLVPGQCEYPLSIVAWILPYQAADIYQNSAFTWNQRRGKCRFHK